MAPSRRGAQCPGSAAARVRSLPPGRPRTRATTTRTSSKTTRTRPTRAAAKERKARASASSRGDSSTRRPNGLRDIRDAALRPAAGQGRAKREARRADSLTGEDRGAAGDVGGVHGVLRDGGGKVRDVAGKVAEIVSLDGLRGRRRLPRGRRVQKTFGEKGCAASFFSRSRRLPGALARGRSGRGARAPQRSEERRGPRPDARARSDSLQRRVGEADATAARRPGAALARADAGPRSAAHEHRRRVRRRVRERRVQALQRPSEASSARPRRCRPNSVRPQGSPQRASAKRRRCPGGARGLRVAKRSASFQPARPKALWAAGRCTARDRRRSEEVPLARAVPSARTVLAPRAGAAGGASPVPRRPRAPCGVHPVRGAHPHGWSTVKLGAVEGKSSGKRSLRISPRRRRLRNASIRRGNSSCSPSRGE